MIGLLVLLLGALLVKPGSSGRYERRKSARGKAHRPNLKKFYRGELADIRPGEFEFTLDLLPGRRGTVVNLDDFVESFEWADEESVMTGAVTLRRRDPSKPGQPKIGNGMRVRCRARWPGRQKWYEVWTMRVQPTGADVVEGTVDVPLKDDLELIRRNRRRHVFRKTKKRGRGWRADEVARAVARKGRFRLGSVAKGTKRFEKIIVRGSDLDALKAAYEKEREHSGRRFVIRMRNGRVDIIAYRRNRILYVIEEQLEEALTQNEQKLRPVTVVEAKGRIGKGSKSKKVSVRVFRAKVVRRFGRITEEKDFGRVASRAELKRKAQRYLAKKIRIKRTAELTVPGIPFLRRGDGIQWKTNEPGWHGPSPESRDRSFVFLTAVRHSVGSAGDYTTWMSVTQDDPFVKDRERRDKERRKKKERERKKRRGS